MPTTNPCAWRELEELRPILRGFLRRGLRDDNDVEDILQETLLRAARHRARQGDPEFLTAWLLRIAENTLKDHLRKQRRRPVVQGEQEFLDSFEGRESTPGEEREVDRLQIESISLERQRLFDCLGRSMRRLNEEDQMVLDSYYSSPACCREIARALDAAPERVKSRLFRARRKLWRIVLDELPELDAQEVDALFSTVASEPAARAPERAPRQELGRRSSVRARLATGRARRAPDGGGAGAPERAPVRAARSKTSSQRGTACSAPAVPGS